MKINVRNVLTVVMLLLALPAGAVCRTVGPNNQRGYPLPYANEGYVHNLALPASINIVDPLLQPVGTVLASSIVTLATVNNLSPEHILYICDLADQDQLRQLYGINHQSANFVTGKEIAGYPGYYPTWFKHVAIRLTNLSTNEYFADWKSSPISGERFVDQDGVERIKIQAKHFDSVKIELMRISRGMSGNSASTYLLDDEVDSIYRDLQPAGYITLKGPGLMSDGIANGTKSQAGWPGEWAGAYSLYNNLRLIRQRSCAISNVTPVVIFPTISKEQLLLGTQVRSNIRIELKCTNMPVSSRAMQHAVMGIQAPSNSLARARNIPGLINSQGGLSYLLSNGYSQNAIIASGVGIRFERNSDGEKMLLMGEGVGRTINRSAGYYAINEGISTMLTTDNDYVIYSYDITAILERLPGQEPTPGAVQAKAYVVVQVQ